jgi:hypothetical protein
VSTDDRGALDHLKQCFCVDLARAWQDHLPTTGSREALLAGFAFEQTSLWWPHNFVRPTANGVGANPRASRQYRWSYRIYDCVPSQPYGFSVEDLLVTGALNARAQAKQFLAMEAILPELNTVLASLDVEQTFWALPRTHLLTTPPRQTAAWCLWRSWALLMGVDGVNVAITYKTLHHKRPWFFLYSTTVRSH